MEQEIVPIHSAPVATLEMGRDGKVTMVRSHEASIHGKTNLKRLERQTTSLIQL